MSRAVKMTIIMWRNQAAALYGWFYWTGIAMAVACLILTFSRNTAFGWRFDHMPLPLSWIAGALAISAFLAAEFGHTTVSIPYPEPALLVVDEPEDELGPWYGQQNLDESREYVEVQ